MPVFYADYPLPIKHATLYVPIKHVHPLPIKHVHPLQTTLYQSSTHSTVLCRLYPLPVAVGPYCEIYQTPAAGDILNTCGPQDKYMENLAKRPCTSEGSPGYFTWTPDDTTPNTVYYQVE